MNISLTVAKQNRRIDSGLLILRFIKMLKRGEITFLPGGQLPPERELSVLFGVSLLTLRHAIRLLIDGGILRSRKGVGTFLVDSDGFSLPDDTRFHLINALYGFTSDEIFEAGAFFKTQIAALAAERACADELNLMKKEIDEMFASLDQPELFVQHNKNFQQTIAAASKNRILAVLMNMISVGFAEETGETVNRPADLKLTAETHSQIYRAIKRRNPEAAQNKMYAHLVKTRKISDSRFKISDSKETS